ncbi:MAG: hypothetical protein Q7T55_08715 [Solirubrobacteraceae bacterium]|nr:hypothetical protein [Solirubrobacteraceae bacterium]
MSVVKQAAAKVREIATGERGAVARRTLPIFATPRELQEHWDDPKVRETVLEGLEIRPDEVIMLFAQGRPGWGNEATAEVRFTDAVPEMGAELLAGKLVRRFKSLVETGEVPTTAHNPSARSDDEE